MEKIDFQNHVFPKEYLKTVEHANAEITIERDDKGNLFFYDKKVRERINPLHDKFFDMEARLKDLDKYGIDIQVLTIPVPGVDRFKPDLAVKLARIANDGIARFVSKNPERAVGLACLPLIDMPSALEEFDRTINDLGLKGIGIFSNVNGKFIDAKEFHPVFAKAQKYDVPIYVHPNVPVISPALGKEYSLNLVFGWPFDTSIAIARIIMSGILERFQRLKLIFAHGGGGMVPFFNVRFDGIASGYSTAIMNATIKKLPSQYLRSMYVDTAVNFAPSLMCSAGCFGINHLVLGTDYPFGPEKGKGFLRMSAETINSMKLSKQEKERICSLNARKLLKI